MTKVSLCLALLAAAARAQSADTTIFRAVLLPANEVPAINNGGRAIADIQASAMRDAAGQIVSGSLDVLLRTTLAAANTATGLNFHNAASGQTAPVSISMGLAPGSNVRALQTGADALRLTAAVAPGNTAGVALLRAFFQDPTRFYLNLTTTDQPNGLMRGQVARAQVSVLLARLTSDDVFPAPNDGGRGFGQVVAIGTRDAAGNWSSGEVYVWANGVTSDLSGYNGFHIHTGAAGAIGAMSLTATLLPGAAPDPTGNLGLGPLYAEIAVANTAQTAAFTNLFNNPSALYLDLHSALNPNGILRAQLRATESTTISLVLDSSNLLTPTPARMQVPVNLTIYTLRNEDGSVAAGSLLADIHLRFPQPELFLGLYLHDALANADGPVSLKPAQDFYSDTGFGAWYGWSAPILNLDTLTDLLENPESHYLNLHTMTYPAGVARAQVGKYELISVGAVIAANLDKDATVVAPGGLISIFGRGLAKVPAGLTGWTGTQLPTRLNGTRVTIAGRAAPLLYVSPNQINAQVPVEVPAGVQKMTVEGSPFGILTTVTVAPAAPAIFFSPLAAVVKNANFSLVTAANPAHAGEALVVFVTGLGQTAPPIRTGILVSATGLSQTSPTGITLGGKPATVIYSAASPGFVGLYQIAFTVPTGLTGNQSLQITMGTSTSNTVTIPVQ